VVDDPATRLAAATAARVHPRARLDLGPRGLARRVKMRPPLDAANDYMRALSRHDYAAMREQLCPADRADSAAFTIRQQFENGDPLLRNVEDWSIAPFDVNRDGDHASVKVDVRPDDNDDPDVFTLLLDEIDGEWRPCGGIYGFEAESSAEVAGARVGVGGVGQHVDE
jgi:hypothetical protein